MPYETDSAYSPRGHVRFHAPRSLFRLFSLIFSALMVWGVLCPDTLSAASSSEAGAEEKASLASSAYSRSVYDRLRAGERVEVPRNSAADLPAHRQPTVYLTFDDGPDKLTPQVLDILKKADVKATFFMVGQNVSGNADIVKRVVQEGHAIGNHSYNHVYKQLYSSFEGFMDQVDETSDILEKAAGFRTQLLRAPGGTSTNFDAFYYYFVELAGYRVFDWNVDSGDATRRGVPASEIIANIKKTKLTSNMVVLMHDGAGHSETVKALPEIIRYFKEKGYAFSAITDQVDPVQFRVAKSKWSRSLNYESFVKYAKKAANGRFVLESLVEREDTPSPEAAKSGVTAGTAPGKEEETAVAVDTAPPIPTAVTVADGQKEGDGDAVKAAEKAKPVESKPLTPLTFTIDNRDWIVDAGQFEETDGRISVPLEKLAAKMGGLLVFNGGYRAIVQMGTKMIEYNLKERSISIFDPMKGVSERHLAKIEMVGGKPWVGLRLAVTLLGGVITGYSQHDGKVLAVDIRMERKPLYFLANL